MQVDGKWVDSISLRAVLYSTAQLELQCTKPKYLKTYHVAIAFQNLSFGLTSLAEGPACIPTVRYDNPFTLKIDDMREDVVFQAPDAIRNIVLVCTRLMASHSSHEALLCQGLDSIFSILGSDNISNHASVPFMRYILRSVQPVLLSDISGFPSAARLIPKLRRVSNAPKVEVKIPEGVLSNFPEYLPLLEFILNEKGLIEIKEEVEERVKECIEQLNLSPNTALATHFIDIVFLRLYNSRNNTYHMILSWIGEFAKFLREKQSFLSQRITPSPEAFEAVNQSIILLYNRLFISTLSYPCSGIEQDFSTFFFDIISQVLDILSEEIELIPYIVDIIGFKFAAILPREEENQTWKEEITDRFCRIDVHTTIRQLSSSSFHPQYWKELYYCQSIRRAGLFDTGNYDKKLDVEDIPDVATILSSCCRSFGLEKDVEIQNVCVEFVKFHLFTGSSLNSIKYFFTSHINCPFNQLPENLSIEFRRVIYKATLLMSSNAVGQGLCRMKIFVTQFPSCVRTINEYYTKKSKEGENLVLFQEALLSTISAVDSAASRGINPEFLLSSVQALLEISKEHNKYLSLLKVIPERFEMHGCYERLLELQYTYNLCVGKMALPHDAVASRLFQMTSSGQRRDLQKLWSLFKKDFFSEVYAKVQQLLFQQSPSFLPAEISRILSVLVVIHSLTNLYTVPAISTYAIFLLRSLSNELSTIIEDPEVQFTAEKQKKELKHLHKLILYQNIYPERLGNITAKYFPPAVCNDKGEEEKGEEGEETVSCTEIPGECVDSVGFQEIMREELSILFPQDVVEDEYILSSLLVAAQRMNTILTNRPKYKHVCNTAQKAIQFFFTCIPEREAQALNLQERLQTRKTRLKQWILDLPENVALLEHLRALGYQNIWEDDLYFIVELKLHSDAEETFFFALLSNFKKLEFLLTDLGITSFNDSLGRVINTEKEAAFTADMTIQELEHRKADVMATIRAAKENACALQCARDYAVEEEKIRSRYLEQMRKQKFVEQKDEEKKKFVMRIHNSFFHSISFCNDDGGLAECYSANGIHAEKPLENGIKVNAKFVSIYEHSASSSTNVGPLVVGDVLGKQLENVEVIYTDQGLYFYGIYPSGHSYNTTEIWASFMKALLLCDYVPAIILPEGIPNSRCFDFLSKKLPCEYFSSVIDFRDDFYSNEGINSYYDKRPERIDIGALVLTKEKMNDLELAQATTLSPDSENMFMRNSNALLNDSLSVVQEKKQTSNVKGERRKDFCGHVISLCLTAANSSSLLNPHRATLQAWARFLSKFISKYIREGKLDRSILTDGFDIDFFNAKTKKKKKKKQTISLLTEEDKTVIIEELVRIFQDIMASFYLLSHQELLTLYEENELYFYELRSHMESVSRVSSAAGRSELELVPQILLVDVTSSLNEMRKKLMGTVTLSSIGLLSTFAQENVIRWCFWNEDKVWRYRGGRNETMVSDFLRFIHAVKYSPYPGVVIARTGELSTLAACEKDVAAYLVGEFIDDVTYEVVTAWTDEHYGRLNFAVSMYFRTMKELHENYGCLYVVMDIKRGAYPRIIASSKVLQWLCWLRLDKLIVIKKEDSYQQKLLGGKLEQFQRVELYLPLIVKGMAIYSFLFSSKAIPLPEDEPYKAKKTHAIESIGETPVTAAGRKAKIFLYRSFVLSIAIGLPAYLILNTSNK